MHSPDLPPSVREELRAAFRASDDQRGEHLEAAARMLNQQLAVDCSDARELVGLGDGCCY
jgi:hypothetical protein